MIQHRDRRLHHVPPQCPRILRLTVLGLVLATLSSDLDPVWAQAEYEGIPINYLTGTPDDAISRLQKRIDGEQIQLEFDVDHGYLKSLLKHLSIPISSQLLVFSKTSLQVNAIGPQTPRAIYFSDDVYVGWVQNGDVIEVSSVDPRLGANFYTLAQRRQSRPVLIRKTHRCLSCHGASQTRNVPGHIVRSVFPSASGLPIFSAGTFRTDDRSPFSQRWGGWYVTGTHGQQHHMGNVVVKLMRDPLSRQRSPSVALDHEAGANIVDLKNLVNTDPYLTRHSDIVALMVLGHQTRTHNAVTRAGFAARRALHDAKVFNKFTEQPADTLTDSARRRIASAGERLLRSLLLVGEHRLTGPIQGTTDFAERFSQLGPRDRRGRSLRDLDLRQQLFRFPCSFVIYGPAFDKLPQPLLEHVFQRLHEILLGRDTSREYTHLSESQRTALLEILQETKPAFDAFCQRNRSKQTTSTRDQNPVE